MSNVISLKKKRSHSLTGVALARNPTKCSFQPSSDCLIGIHCCVCQECWQNLAVICIKQEGVQISLLFCIPLPLLHPKKNQHAIHREKKTLAGLVQFCTIGSTLLFAWFDTFFSPLLSPVWIHLYKSYTIWARTLFSLIFLQRILLKMSWHESCSAVWTFYLCALLISEIWTRSWDDSRRSLCPVAWLADR